MSEETRRIEREVEEKRRDVQHKVEALRHRLTPGQLVDEVGDYLRHSNGGDLVRNLGSQVRDNPLPLALIGAGIAWLMAGEGRRHRYSENTVEGPVDAMAYPSAGSRPGYTGADSPHARASSSAPDEKGLAGKAADTLHEAGRSASAAGQGAVDAAKSAAGTVKAAASDTGEAISAGLASARETAESGYDYVSESAGRAGRGLSRYQQQARRTLASSFYEEPLVMGALAVAVGAAIGSMLPSTEVEDRTVGPLRDRSIDEAKDFAKEQVETAKEVAASAYEGAKEEAERQGLIKDTETGTVAEKVDKVVRAGAQSAKDTVSG